MLVGEAGQPVVPLAPVPFLVLPPVVGDGGDGQQEGAGQGPQVQGVAERVPGGALGEVGPGGDDGAAVAQGYDVGARDAPHARAGGVVDPPAHAGGSGGEDPHGRHEDGRVLGGVLARVRADQDAIPGRPQEGGRGDEDAPAAEPVGTPGHEDGHDAGRDVRGDGPQLGLDGGVAQRPEDGGQEQRDGRQVDAEEEEHEGRQVGADAHDGLFDVPRPHPLATLVTLFLVLVGDAPAGDGAVSVGQEPGRGGRVGEETDPQRSDQHRDQAFEEENVPPRVERCRGGPPAGDERQCRREETTESTCHAVCVDRTRQSTRIRLNQETRYETRAGVTYDAPVMNMVTRNASSVRR